MYIIDIFLFEVSLQNNIVYKLAVIVLFLRTGRTLFLAFPQLPPTFQGLWTSHPRGRDPFFSPAYLSTSFPYLSPSLIYCFTPASFGRSVECNAPLKPFENKHKYQNVI